MSECNECDKEVFAAFVTYNWDPSGNGSPLAFPISVQEIRQYQQWIKGIEIWDNEEESHCLADPHHPPPALRNKKLLKAPMLNTIFIPTITKHIEN